MRPLHSFQAQDLSGWLPKLDSATVTGISVAIAGNILISLALNLQKLAHRRLNEAQMKGIQDEDGTSTAPSLNGSSYENVDSSGDESSHTIRAFRHPSESTPLLPTRHPTRHPNSISEQPKLSLWSRLNRTTAVIPVDVVLAAPQLPTTPRKAGNEAQNQEEGSESDYLKSKLWWLGFLLMNVGELGNFISYAWAPASVVAPLGTFALIANCFFAPLIMKERFRKRDLLGIVLAIIGAVTVVLSSNTSDTRLNPDLLLTAISQTPFIIYSCIYVVGAIFLSALSNKPIGGRLVFIDVGLCALFGGFTVLSTKAVSTLLTMQWIDMFTHPITYPVILVLVLTGIGQIRYLNRALMKFDSKIVIPSQFVLFNLSAIIGSAILYGDFQRATFHQIVTFLYGCAATFAGVFIIASASEQPATEDEHTFEDEQPSLPQARVTFSPVRPRATLIMPPHTPNLRRRQSTVSLMGLSNAHHLLLVHTPPREIHGDWDRGSPASATPSPTAYRNRATSWFGEVPRDVLPRDSSPANVGRRRPDHSIPTQTNSSTVPQS